MWADDPMWSDFLAVFRTGNGNLAFSRLGWTGVNTSAPGIAVTAEIRHENAAAVTPPRTLENKRGDESILVLLDRRAATVFAKGIDAAIAEIPAAEDQNRVPDVFRAIADRPD